MKLQKRTLLFFQRYFDGDSSYDVVLFIRANWKKYQLWSKSK